MRIIRKRFFSWSEEIRDKLSTFVLSPTSGMTKQLQSGENLLTYVAFINDEPVGWATVDNGKDKVFYEPRYIYVYVAPDFRERGIGKALIQRAIKNRTIPTTVFAHNWSSFSFYYKILDDIKDKVKIRSYSKNYEKVFEEKFPGISC